MSSGRVPAALDRLLIRRGVPADAMQLSSFAAHCFAQAFAADNRPEDLQKHLAASFGEHLQRRELENPDLVTLLAFGGDALLGYAQVGRQLPPPCVSEADCVELARFYVEASAHGRGVAQQLMAASFEAARGLGGRHLWLGVWERNPRAIAFYKKAGFREVGAKDFIVGSDRQTDRVMVARLPG